MLIQFLGLAAWAGIACLSALLTPMAMRSKNLKEWIAAAVSGIGSVIIFRAIMLGTS